MIVCLHGDKVVFEHIEAISRVWSTMSVYFRVWIVGLEMMRATMYMTNLGARIKILQTRSIDHPKTLIRMFTGMILTNSLKDPTGTIILKAAVDAIHVECKWFSMIRDI